MIRFFELHLKECPGKVLGVLASPDKRRVFDWFPNTRPWHRDRILERDIFHESYRLIPLSAERVLEVRSGLPRRNERNQAPRRRLAESEVTPASWTMSDAQVGVPVQPRDVPLLRQ